MKFGIAWEISGRVDRKFDYFDPLENYLESWLYEKSYGDGVIALYIGLSCHGHIPGAKTAPLDFDTGYVVHKKYTKSARRLEATVKLNYAAVMQVSSQDAAVPILSAALQGVCRTLRQLNVPAFDLAAFERDLAAQLAARAWLTHPLPRVE